MTPEEKPARDEAAPPAEGAAETVPVPDSNPNADPPRSATAASPLAHTRASAAWMALIFFAVVLVLLLIFIVQNTATVPINYLGATGHLPISVAMLLSAVGGVLLAASAGTMRIIQLRRRLRRSEHDRGRSELRSHR